MNINLKKLFDDNELDNILKSYSVEEVVHDLDFKDVIKLAWRMLFSDYDNFERREFGVGLLFALREYRLDIWDSDWRYDALLGLACDNNYRYDERYEAFKRAYDKAEKIEGEDHPGLLISLAGCYSAPGDPIISEDDALILVKRAMEKKIYKNGAWKFSAIYHTKGDMENHQKWKDIAMQMSDDEVSPHIYPQFLWDEEICKRTKT